MSASLVSLESAFSVFMYFSSAIRTTYLTLLPDLSNRTCQNDTETKIVCSRVCVCLCVWSQLTTGRLPGRILACRSAC